MAREQRPSDDAYYVAPSGMLRQGDLFRDVPQAYPLPADEVILEEGATEHDGIRRRFLSGPFDAGFGLLVSPRARCGPRGSRASTRTRCAPCSLSDRSRT